MKGIVRGTLRCIRDLAPAFPTTEQLAAVAGAVLARFGIVWPEDGENEARTPITGGTLGCTRHLTGAEIDGVVERANDAFRSWRLVPPPQRGELVRRLGQLLRDHKHALAELVTIEAGKILAEAQGEVQEMIDMCDLAVGLSRQLYGLTLASERRDHRMAEVWQPLGVVAVITSFNFPVAVWAWNAAAALVCGDAVIWKPSEKTVLTARACQALVEQAAAATGAPRNVSQVVLGGPEVGHALVDHPGVALVSATGSTAMGRVVGPRVAARFGRCLLELGGNNAAIVAPSADLDLAVRAIVFAAAGTAGQRCTTLRRLIVHDSRHDEVVTRLTRAYQTLRVGNPREPGVLVGPLIDRRGYEGFERALAQVAADGGDVVTGGSRDPALSEQAPDAFYVRPAVATMAAQTELVQRETFAPLLYVLRYQDWDEAMASHNAARHGLSSSIFTNDLREAERFLSPRGSDCGIANVNIGPSGAEIGGAFGGEKETGGGREAGSDAWKAYMRRQTCTVNFGHDLPLAQGVEFG
ncbi:MAG: aldehyde dehydrogenase family protein [Actinomycetota bacterium]|nr:aldehyde dehydrogenase family protein [Actinomycetota bacterium]MDQ6946143.1 aldehyde dehydrogenase family protein [Actinomycetota bacterium]